MTRFAGQRVLVTGATGFVGSALVRALLERGAEVHGLSRRRSNAGRVGDLRGKHRWHVVDLTDRAAVRAAFRRARPRIVYHAATFRPIDGDLVRMAATHVLGTAHLLAAALERPPDRLVFLTTSMEYGQTSRLLVEDPCPGPHTRYGVTKLAATLLARQVADEHGLDAVVLRLSHVYGPGEPPSRLIPTAIRAGLAGGELPLTRETWRRDYVFIDDVVEACLRAAFAPPAVGQIINVASGIQHSNLEAARLVRRLTGGRLQIRPGLHPRRLQDRRHFRADVRRARRLLEWTPRSLEQGLAATISWMRSIRGRRGPEGGRPGRGNRPGRLA